MKLDSVTKKLVSICCLADLNLGENWFNSLSELELLSLKVFVDILFLPHRLLNSACNGALTLSATFFLAQYL
jgi:hypothetical protein